MDSAPEKTSSAPPPGTNLVSQLGVVSQLAAPLPQHENRVLTREGNAQTSSQHGGGLFELRPLSSRMNSTQRTTSSKHPSRCPSSAAERTQKTKQHRPGGSSVGHTGATQAPKSRSGKSDVCIVERSIEYPHERSDKVAPQRHQEMEEGRPKELESKAQVIETRFREQQRTLKGLCEQKKDQPIRLPTVPLLGCKGFQARPGVRKQSPTKLMCESALGDNTAISGAPALRAEPNVLEARESSENEWMEIKLEDADIPLGQEEWEDDIVPALIPKGSAQNAWWLDANA